MFACPHPNPLPEGEGRLFRIGSYFGQCRYWAARGALPTVFTQEIRQGYTLRAVPALVVFLEGVFRLLPASIRIQSLQSTISDVGELVLDRDFVVFVFHLDST